MVSPRCAVAKTPFVTAALESQIYPDRAASIVRALSALPSGAPPRGVLRAVRIILTAQVTVATSE